MKRLICLTTACWALAGGAVLAQDRTDLDTTIILGNRELPKVLYIVPWKKPMPGDLASRPLVSVVDEALAPIDRDVLRRQVQYRSQQQAQQQQARLANATAKPAPP